ncbi:peptide methionine sulfoxide reductase [Chloropicon primus]|uniref:peptide-methionine (S)-S-oxide reductase n=1 Tax=Chloropicon primus TaxID=1764295 RepID=A0A5B8MIA1_9CHLO|nr:peptide methionine sulfoxide reductase [Chloropicon primus]UPQ99005.1 peptide methionine sulfoxide reductase [Chloropicon primus]|eukprot:QDZ19794.1 peptide methionine sulfoxide reductase [Chloropicon primus]
MGAGNSMATWPPEGNKLPLATFAAGCFWGVELRFQRVEGVEKTAVGYIQGEVESPTYELVCSGMTGHTEAVQMTYDPSVVTFGELCDVFYAGHNPKQKNGQGGDVGTQYRSGIYYHDEEQKKVAEEKKAQIEGAVTEVQAAAKFWPAEEYHQQYLEKGGRYGSGQSAAKRCTDPIRCYG